MRQLYLSHEGKTNCEGISRRDALKVGSLSVLGLNLAEFLALRQAAASGKNALKDRNCILLFMNGGPTHIDTWDPKPEAPAEYRGEFQPIDVKGGAFQICEHLPKMAAQGDRFAVVRSLTSPEASHERACHYMLTGYRILPTLEYPAYGSVALKEKGYRNALPPYVAIPQTLRGGTAGYLGTVYQPFSVGSPDNNGRLTVRDVRNPAGEERMKARAELLAKQDGAFRKNDPDGALGALDQFYQRAYDLVGSPEAKRAFDLSTEPEALKDEYGRNPFGQGCLLARRMIEAGSRFVTLSLGGWDTHRNNFQSLRDRLLPPLDSGFATLLRDLADRGMLDDTLVLWMGEFGRTPKINGTAGRDHFPRCQSVVFAGGGVRGGQAVGKSDATASLPAERPVTPEDMAATIYHLLGIDHTRVYNTSTGRPIRIAEKGEVVRELCA